MEYDFTLFPAMETGYLITPKPCESLRPHKEIYNRFCSAIYMASRISVCSGKHACAEFTKCCAYVRATLAEFSSIEECVSQLYPELNQNCYRVRESNNPAFHFLRLLRNYNIHLSENTLSAKKINISLLSNPDTDHEIDALYIDNLDVNEILKLKTAKYYTKAELENFISIFEERQHVFGVPHLFLATIVSYSEYVSVALKR